MEIEILKLKLYYLFRKRKILRNEKKKASKLIKIILINKNYFNINNIEIILINIIFDLKIPISRTYNKIINNKNYN